MNPISKSRIAAACFALAAWLPLHANAGLLDDDEARKAILDLRTKVENLSRDLNARIDTKSDKSAALDLVNQHEQTMQEIAAPARPDRSAGQRNRHRAEAPEGFLRRPRCAHRQARAAPGQHRRQGQPKSIRAN